MSLDLSHHFTHFATKTARAAGDAKTFILCVALIVLWGASGPVFHYSETWQLIINTSTTIITFLMVFLIQNTQNREGAALQAKLDELIRVSSAENRFIGIDSLTETEVASYRAWSAQRADEEARAKAPQIGGHAEGPSSVEAARAKAKIAADKAV